MNCLLKNCILKHGKDQGTNVYTQYVKKQKINGKTIDYFIEKYGTHQGVKMYDDLNKKKSMSYNGFLIRANGDVDLATKKHNEYWKKQYWSRLLLNGISNSSQEFFKKIHKELLKINIHDIYYANFNQEWGLTINNKQYYLDFFMKDTGKVIEYYGDYYHANPQTFNDIDTIKQFGISYTAKQIWDQDAIRINNIKMVPYIKDILIVWENDVQQNEMEILNTCITFLLK